MRNINLKGLNCLLLFALNVADQRRLPNWRTIQWNLDESERALLPLRGIFEGAV